MQTNKIDPALGLLKEFNKVTKGSADHIDKMRKQAIFTDGAVSAKHKALGAMLWSISARCEPCIKYYVIQASKHGATEAELGEFLAVASTMGGCVGEMWALKAYSSFKGMGGADNGSTADSTQCCE